MGGYHNSATPQIRFRSQRNRRKSRGGGVELITYGVYTPRRYNLAPSSKFLSISSDFRDILRSKPDQGCRTIMKTINNSVTSNLGLVTWSSKLNSDPSKFAPSACHIR
jgi:hypothetical protein